MTARPAKFVDTVTTDGHGVQDKFVTNGLDQMLNSAFTSSLGELADGPVRDPEIAKPAS